ncbi:MAG: hypothetical protein U0269_32215 [Polyangiales bacterium]
MGYDCTLHLIDPSSIERFVRWFLGETVDASAFEKAFDTKGLRDEVLEKLERDARSGGRALLHALLMFCSSEAPHEDSRGFCLGLWDKLGLGLADELPDGLVSSSSLAPSLARITTRYPAFAHQLYTGIEGNYAVGDFVPPEKVAAVRAHVETVLDRVSSDWLPSLEKLLAVLGAAESRGLAYWEATDLDVANGNPSLLVPLAKKAKSKARAKSKSPEKPKAKRISMGAQFVHFAREIDGVVYAHSLSDSKTWLFDARGGEPVLRTILGPAFWSIVQRADGAVLGAGMIPHTGNLLAELDPDGGSFRPLAMPANVKDIQQLIRVGDRVLSVCQGPRGVALVWLDDQSRVDLPGVATHAFELFDWGDSTAFVNANGPSFRLRDNKLEPLADLPLLTFYPGFKPRFEARTRDGQLVVAAAETLSQSEYERRRYAREELPYPRLILLSRDGRLSEAVPALTAANSAFPARDGAVIVWQTDPIERDLLKVFWYDKRELASIPHALLGEKRGHCQSAIYCSALDELWVSFNSHIVRLPWAVVEALPRQTVDEYTASKHALLAETERKEHERLWAKIRAKESVYRFDDPKAFIYEGEVVEHPDRGRALIREVDYTRERFIVEFEDRTTLELPRPKRG